MQRGFTLLELIIVMVVIVLILGMSTVFFANALPSAKLNSVTREIAATFRQARSLAQNRGEGQILIVDLDGKTFGMADHRAKAIPGEITMRIVDPLEGTIEKGKYSFIFYSTGGIEGGSLLLSYKSRTVTIEPDPVVGSLVVKQ